MSNFAILGAVLMNVAKEMQNHPEDRGNIAWSENLSGVIPLTATSRNRHMMSQREGEHRIYSNKRRIWDKKVNKRRPRISAALVARKIK